MADKKKKRKWIKWVIILVVLAAIVGFVVISGQASAAAMARMALADSLVQSKKGDISVVVQAGGSISSADSITELAPVAATIDTVTLKNGDRVEAGQTVLTLKSATLSDEITKLQSDLQTQDSQLRMMDKSKSSKISAPVSGRVKAIYTADGQNVNAAMTNHGGLLLLSIDDVMAVSFTPSQEIHAGDAVRLRIGEQEIESTIADFSNNTALVLFPDNSYELGQMVTVMNGAGEGIGEGPLQVNNPFYLSATAGVVKTIRVALGDQVSTGDTLVELTDSVYSEEYRQLLQNRQRTLENLQDKQEAQESLEIKADRTGIITELTLVEGASVMEGSPLFSVGSDEAFELTVAVDELDVARVEVGQAVSIAVDAVADTTYTGKVTRISGAGDFASGVTSFDVTVSLEKADKLRTGMSARADIQVANATDVVLIPAGALKTVDGEKYVVIMPAPESADLLTTEGVETKVKVGLNDGAYVEILEGLEEGQYVKDFTVRADSLQVFGMRGGGASGGNSANNNSNAGAAS